MPSRDSAGEGCPGGPHKHWDESWPCCSPTLLTSLSHLHLFVSFYTLKHLLSTYCVFIKYQTLPTPLFLSSFFFFFFFEPGSHYIAQASLENMILCLSLLSAKG
jgi:hypothetical protein